MQEQILKYFEKNAKEFQNTIIFDEWEDERIILAVKKLTQKKILKPLFPVKSKDLEKLKIILKRNKIKYYSIAIFEDFKDELIKLLEEIRKDKLKENEAKTLIEDIHYFSTLLLKSNYAQGIVSGSLSPTKDVIKPALQIIKTKQGVQKASSFFFMVKEKETFLFADCGFQINPTPQDIVEITKLSVESCKKFNYYPRVALLSFSTKKSSDDEISQKTRDAYELLLKENVDFEFEGDIQFDAALDKKTREIKIKDTKLTNNANIFIFPDLNSGNIGYKIAKILGDYNAIGPIIQGLNQPVNDLSRGCSVDEIYYTACITSIIAGKKNENN
ncbi:MAG: phosphotransacetylase [Candidatus Nanoarchaeia archaeon]|nr:phosphotransacetylase [Candidatus Nanoarchaeia archaeon]